ncbi:methyl-accepting chemotaxis protein [Geobacter hydrogenophilus]|uniref:Methyl-accepting chemotaxis protein n=1 Tax=Geobacter hydrogenophilus TaxID=40983 RepID=A0A9W6FZ26_9BACT|nr:methyl-accepting chemotaxis protein [Geobacter hydrogenophilus]MBT0894715.1 methyl-accepting chemotaxis protein [Geobacter hydrogenophilus]GLI37447.1 methyl-accepting chemotaxis protein [Geobacter hydrogenophilus]
MKWFNNFKVGTKLIAGFVSVAMIAAIIGFIGIWKINQVDNGGAKLYEKITVPLGDLGSMAVAFQRVRINMRDAVETKDPSQRQGYVENITKLRQTITERGERFEKTILTDEGRKLYNEFKEARKIYGVLIDKVLQLNEAGRNAEAVALMHGDAKKAAFHEQEILDKLTESKEKQAKLTAENNNAVSAAASRLMTTLAVIGVILAVGLGLFISRMITTPLGKAVEVANRLADGDLTVNVVATSRDETGQLLSAMENMVRSLRDMVTQTVTISTGIAAASSQLHATSEQIATGAEEVASQSGTVATASEEMAATSSDIARNCGAAAEASMQSTASATAGARVVQETITGMGVIANRVRQTSKTVEALGTRSEEIGEIVGTIEDIADQTNLLALNAAIEAARAGEQGRGFAVVADEVRALAERTTKATKEIGAMIKAIQGETREAVRAMDEGVQEAEKGAVSAHKSGEALEEILSRINEVAMQVSQIATAAEQQTATTSEVTTNIQQITEVVHQTANGAEETAGAAAQLARQATELQTLVGRFTLARGGGIIPAGS